MNQTPEKLLRGSWDLFPLQGIGYGVAPLGHLIVHNVGEGVVDIWRARTVLWSAAAKPSSILSPCSAVQQVPEWVHVP